MSVRNETEYNLEGGNVREPQTEEEYSESEEGDNDELIEQDEINDDDNNNNKKKANEEVSLVKKETVEDNIPQSPPQLLTQTHTQTQSQSITLPKKNMTANKSNKKHQSKIKSKSNSKPLNYIHTHAKEQTKSIYSKITETMFNQYLSTDVYKKPQAYECLISENYISRAKEQTKSKDNDTKFQNMLNRQSRYTECKISKQKQRKEKEDEEFRTKCTWRPNALKKERNDNSIKKRNIKEFYLDQQKFVEQKEMTIKKLKDDQDNKMVLAMTMSPQISSNSKEIAKAKIGKESDSDFRQRLHSQKQTGIKSKIAHIDFHQTTTTTTTTKNHKGRTKSEMDQIIIKLQYPIHNEKLKPKNLIKDFNKDNNKEIISQVTKKIIIQKLLKSFHQSRYFLFNIQHNNHQINYNDYSRLMKEIGFVYHKNKLDQSIVDKSINITQHLSSDKLLKESFDLYHYPKEGLIDLDQCLLFSLVLIGIYKGKRNNESKEVKSDDDAKFISTVTSNMTTHTNHNNISSNELIKMLIPDLDLSKYSYPTSIVNQIKKGYQCYYDNLSYNWANERALRKNQKNTSAPNEKNNHERSTNQSCDKNQFSYKKTLFKKAHTFLETDTTNDKGNIKSVKIEQIYQVYQQKKENKLRILREIKSKEDMKECTFQPNATTKKVNRNVSANIEKLYNDGKLHYNKKKRNEDLKKAENMKEINQCTFKPSLHYLSKEMFDSNPLEEDTHLKKELELRENARINKDISNRQMLKGLTNTGFVQINTLCNQNESAPSMRFDIEKKTCKDTFEKLSQSKIAKNKEFNSPSFCKRSETSSRVPILNVEVNIDHNKNTVKLEIFKDDDPIKITEAFCLEHGLSDDKKQKLQSIIQDRLNETE